MYWFKKTNVASDAYQQGLYLMERGRSIYENMVGFHS